ncbi:MAG: LysR family transcriptional regulator, partial [Ruminococcus sp.]|nr:LysR family transcriptional regulator [Ruminococcus sp.]
EGEVQTMQFGEALRHIPLLRGGRPIKSNYCAFWKIENNEYYIREFAEILKEKFSSDN